MPYPLARPAPYHAFPPPAPKTPPRTPPPPARAREPVATALSALLADAELCDVTLVAADGSRHPAVRALLAARSPFFRHLLFGTFQEARQRAVQLHLPAAAIRHVLEFVYTDTCAPLRAPPAPAAKRRRVEPAEDPRQLAQLLVAADYLAIPPLLDAASDAIARLLRARADVACTVIQMVPPTLDAHQKAREVVRKLPREALGVRDVRDPRDCRLTHPAVRVLSAERLADVLQDPDIFTSDTYLFKVLQYWASEGPKERTAEAARLSQYVDLERMKPSFLRDHVRPSGLVPEPRIQDTFEQQALEAERGRALYDNFRGGSVFANGTKFLRATDYGFRNHTLGPWLTDGRHDWTFRIHTDAVCLWIGFASAIAAHGRPFFEDANGWAYSTDGRTRPQQKSAYGNNVTGPTALSGSVVKVTLNLLKSGTVSVVVDASHNVFTVFQGLKSQAKRFIPVICMNSPAKVELIEERHHIG